MHKARMIEQLCLISGHLNGLAAGLETFHTADLYKDAIEMMRKDSEVLMTIAGEIVNEQENS